MAEARSDGKYGRLEEDIADEQQQQQQQHKPIPYSTLFNVGPNRPPVDYLCLSVTSIILQLVSPLLFMLELMCGLNLAYRSLQACRMSRAYFAKGEYELAALTSYRAGRYAATSLVLNCFLVFLLVTAVLTVYFTKPEQETAFEFKLKVVN